MALNPNGAGNTSWNYSKSDRDDYSLEMYGTILTIQEVQARMYNPGGGPGAPRFWPDGNPVWNIRVGFAAPDGSLKSITFQEAGKAQREGKKPSLHMQLYAISGGSMRNLIGKTVHMWTWPADPNTGQTWGQGNPRKFGLEEVTDGTKFELAQGVAIPEEFMVDKLYCNDGAQGGAPAPQAPPAMYGQFYAPPTAQQYQPQPYQQPQYQPQQYQPMMQQPPMQQPMPTPPMQMQQQPAIQQMPPQPASAPMPQGMDPAVAAAMQMAGAVNVQPADNVVPAEAYGDIPF